MSILKNTTLAAIVRDEIMNPAGGVERWLRDTLPYVEEAVVVDTGSIDGTREKLDDLKGEFPHLRVYDRQFDGFSSCRNFSLDQVRTPWVLVLDADEIVCDNNRNIKEGYKALSEITKRKLKKPEIYTFFIDSDSRAHHKRLFSNSPNIRFVPSIDEDNDVGEYLAFPKTIVVKDAPLSVRIVHFCPLDYVMKKERHYAGIFKGLAPSQIPGNEAWKKFNPRRDFYK